MSGDKILQYIGAAIGVLLLIILFLFFTGTSQTSSHVQYESYEYQETTTDVERYLSDEPVGLDVSKVSMSAPQNGRVMISGLAGAFDNGDQFIVYNTRTFDIVRSKALADGSFRVSIAAHVGDDLQIRRIVFPDDPNTIKAFGSLADAYAYALEAGDLTAAEMIQELQRGGSLINDDGSVNLLAGGIYFSSSTNTGYYIITE